MPRLEWRDPPTGRDGVGSVGYCGGVVIARVVQRPADGRWLWQVVGVQVRDIGPATGETASLSNAQREAERSWAKWLKLAALTSVGGEGPIKGRGAARSSKRHPEHAGLGAGGGRGPEDFDGDLLGKPGGFVERRDDGTCR